MILEPVKYRGGQHPADTGKGQRDHRQHQDRPQDTEGGVRLEEDDIGGPTLRGVLVRRVALQRRSVDVQVDASPPDDDGPLLSLFLRTGSSGDRADHPVDRPPSPMVDDDGAVVDSGRTAAVVGPVSAFIVVRFLALGVAGVDGDGVVLLGRTLGGRIGHRHDDRDVVRAGGPDVWPLDPHFGAPGGDGPGGNQRQQQGDESSPEPAESAPSRFSDHHLTVSRPGSHVP